MKGSLKCSESDFCETRLGDVQQAYSVCNLLAAHPARTAASK